MDLATFTTESALNRRAYENRRAQIRRDYAGQYVAFAGGQVVGAASTFAAAAALVKRLEVVPSYYLVFPADAEPDFDLIYDLAGSPPQTFPNLSIAVNILSEARSLTS